MRIALLTRQVDAEATDGTQICQSLWDWHRGHQIRVKVVGFAASHGEWWITGPRESYSAGYVIIFPRGWWAG